MIQYLLIPFLALFVVLSPFSINAQSTHPQHEQPANNQAHDNIPVIQDEPDIMKKAEEPDNFQAKFMKMLFILALLIGFMILASMMLKRMTRQRVLNMNTQSNIKVIETRYLSPRSTLFLLEIEGKELLIAESHAGVSHIATFGESANKIQNPESIN